MFRARACIEEAVGVCTCVRARLINQLSGTVETFRLSLSINFNRCVHQHISVCHHHARIVRLSIEINGTPHTAHHFQLDGVLLL